MSLPAQPREVESIRHSLECWPQRRDLEVCQLVRDCSEKDIIEDLNMYTQPSIFNVFVPAK